MYPAHLPSRPILVIYIMVSMLCFSPHTSVRAQDQQEMNREAQADFEKADKELNEVYKLVLAALNDEIAKSKLVAAQKAWLQFRDTQATFTADDWRDGSMAPTAYEESRTETTKARIAQLRDWLKDRVSK